MKINHTFQNPSIRYRVFFIFLSILILSTTLFTKIYRIGGPVWWEMYGVTTQYVLWRISIFLSHSMPFLVLAFMATRWGIQKRNISRSQFVCRILGIFSVYFVYLYIIRFIVKSAESGNAPIGIQIYFLSMPFVIPLLYWVGYLVPARIFNHFGETDAYWGDDKEESNK